MKIFLTGLLLGTCHSTRQTNKLSRNEDFRYLLEPGIKFWIEQQRDSRNEINLLQCSNQPWKYSQRYAYIENGEFSVNSGGAATRTDNLRKQAYEPDLFLYKSRCQFPQANLRRNFGDFVKSHFWSSARQTSSPKAGCYGTQSSGGRPKSGGSNQVQNCEVLEIANPIRGPKIQISGLYVANTVHQMDPDQNYIGMVILAVREGTTWYTDGNGAPYQTVDGTGNNVRIRPGYIVMAPYDDLVFYQGTDREKLFQYFFGKTERQLQIEQKHFVTLDFSYQALDMTTEEVVCDFVLDECAQQATRQTTAPKVGRRENGRRGKRSWSRNRQSTRTNEWTKNTSRNRNSEEAGNRNRQTRSECKNEKLFNLIKFAINKFRESENRLTRITDIYNVQNENVLELFPVCNACANANDCNQAATCESELQSYICKCPTIAGWSTNNDGKGQDGCQFNPCASNQCHSSATCNPQGNSYTCTCPAAAGWTTSNAGKGANGCIFNACIQNDCHSSATCAQSGAGYTCTCPRTGGWITSNQGKGRSGCQFNPCHSSNHNCHSTATCSVRGNSFTCTCPRGWLGTGTRGCYRNPCDTNNCRSQCGSRRPACIVRGTSFTCQCTD